MWPRLWQLKQTTPPPGAAGYGCGLGGARAASGRYVAPRLSAFWISLATSTSSLEPTSFSNICCSSGWPTIDLVCLRITLKRVALWSPFARLVSTNNSNAAPAAYGSNRARGRANCCRSKFNVESTSCSAAACLSASTWALRA